jgi:hypothetical protein
MAEDLGYMTGVPPEVRDVFFDELSKYSIKELVRYFNEGTVSIDILEDLGKVVLPKNHDNRRELVHHYLLIMPEDFCAEFRSHLDDLVKNSNVLYEVRAKFAA